MNRNDIEPFFLDIVIIGIPHLFADRLFYYTGKITEINEHDLTLIRENGAGVVKLDFDQIQEIRRVR